MLKAFKKHNIIKQTLGNLTCKHFLDELQSLWKMFTDHFSKCLQLSHLVGKDQESELL